MAKIGIIRRPCLFGSEHHYGKSGRSIGRSEPGFFGSQKAKWG